MIDVLVGPSVPRQQALKAANQPVPPNINARLLIDTGASCTVLDHDVVAKLLLTPTSFTPAHTPSTDGTPAMMPSYDIYLAIPHATISRQFSALPILAGNFRAQAIDGLLGRDILAHCLFVLSGPDNAYVLSF